MATSVESASRFLRRLTPATTVLLLAPVVLSVLAAAQSLAPPWPSDAIVAVLTLSLQAVVLLASIGFVFTLQSSRPQRVLTSSALFALFSLTFYLLLSEMFVVTVPTAGTAIRVITGFEEAPAAELAVLAHSSAAEKIMAVGLNVELLWTQRSIAVIRFSLLGFWLGSMCAAVVFSLGLVHVLQDTEESEA